MAPEAYEVLSRLLATAKLRRSKNSLEDEIAAEDKMVEAAVASQNKRWKNREEREERERQEEEDRKAEAIQQSLDAGASSRQKRNKY